MLSSKSFMLSHLLQNPSTGACNRIRGTKINSKRFAASWSELGKVFIYDLSKPWNALTGGEAALKDYNAKRLDARIKPCASFKGHLTEGYALDWSTMVPGKLISGDCKGMGSKCMDCVGVWFVGPGAASMNNNFN